MKAYINTTPYSIYSNVDAKILNRLGIPIIGDTSNWSDEKFESYGFYEVNREPLKDNYYYNGTYTFVDNKVWEGQSEIVPMPIPFDWAKAENGLAKAFREKFFDPRIDKYILSRNLQLNDFKTFTWYLCGLLEYNIIDSADYSRVRDLLLEQNIDIDNYKPVE
jgi:hypothetical protein